MALKIAISPKVYEIPWHRTVVQHAASRDLHRREGLGPLSWPGAANGAERGLGYGMPLGRLGEAFHLAHNPELPLGQEVLQITLRIAHVDKSDLVPLLVA